VGAYFFFFFFLHFLADAAPFFGFFFLHVLAGIGMVGAGLLAG
jgi:hypothetical protein